MVKQMKNYEIDVNMLPVHIAIIMDGNGTWAIKRGLPRNMGHRKGTKTLVELTRYANEIGLKYLTVFAFSTENWSRPKEEVDYLMKLPLEFINEYQDKFNNENIRFRVIGKIEKLPLELQQKITEFEEKTKDNQGLNFIIAMNYGSYDEIITAVNKIIQDKIPEVNEETFEKYLYTSDIPKVDLLIRTSGQLRISNFLLWQIAYSELYFTKTLWPDFNKKEFNKALQEYISRDRRFGGIK